MRKKWPLIITTLCFIASLASSCSDEATILAINSEFDFDALNDISYELTRDGQSFSHLEGHNIADGDYEITSSLLTIKKNYLVNLTPGNYDFTAWFANRSEMVTLTVLDKNNEYRLINGSFETGDLFGWESNTVFKGESNLMAFTNSAIVANGEILSTGSLYGGEGNYVCGMPSSNTKIAFEEKLGRLISSDFVLGGSGYISFKLGASKNSDLVYIRVIDRQTGSEIARYGNSLFDKDVLALNNASLHRYQADLSAHIGQEMHLEIIDLGGRDWDFATFDAFESYLETPLVGTTEAIDIKPGAGLGYAPNQLANGYFDDGMNHWQISEASGWQKADSTSDTWRIHEGKLKSNSGGDSSRGLIRSSFFRVDGSGIISLELGAAQGTRFDKDTFVSIKERGTNQEIIRFANNRHNGNEMIKYFVDLADYLGHVMYFEIVDNAMGSWDTIFVDNIITYYEEKPNFTFLEMARDLND